MAQEPERSWQQRESTRWQAESNAASIIQSHMAIDAWSDYDISTYSSLECLRFKPHLRVRGILHSKTRVRPSSPPTLLRPHADASMMPVLPLNSTLFTRMVFWNSSLFTGSLVTLGISRGKSCSSKSFLQYFMRWFARRLAFLLQHLENGRDRFEVEWHLLQSTKNVLRHSILVLERCDCWCLSARRCRRLSRSHCKAICIIRIHLKTCAVSPSTLAFSGY